MPANMPVPLGAVMANDVWELVYNRLADLAREHRTTLIFVNTRRLAERLTRADQLRAMLEDGDWDVAGDMREHGRLLVGYLREVHDLIPDDQPLLGLLGWVAVGAALISLSVRRLGGAR